uniref:Immunoglobulin V-set domain-containing protein n=1 Tax=Astyanax mexicanus TaxID=7994 RepID=A0A3B1K8Y4_ASTMX
MFSSANVPVLALRLSVVLLLLVDDIIHVTICSHWKEKGDHSFYMAARDFSPRQATNFLNFMQINYDAVKRHSSFFRLRKSVEIQEDDKADYDCYVSHSSLTEPVGDMALK